VDEAESMFMKELEKKLAEQHDMTRREFTAKLNEQVRNSLLLYYTCTAHYR
jgi:hypothetical protein